MQQPPPRRGSGQQPAAFTFEAKLQDEEPLLESLLAALGRGVLPDGAWDRLHAASQRDQRVSELAFAFESVSQGKRIKMATPAAGAEFLFQAARFLSEVLGDDRGAITYLERAIALAPAHAAAFARLEALLTKTGNGKKLAEVYAAAAHHRPRAEQAPLLKQAAVLLAESGGPDEKVIELLQQASRLEPGDAEIREGLEVLYLKTNRLRDVVRLQEQALATDPPPDAATRRALLVRILDLYSDKLHEPERAMPYVEQLLGLEPTHEDARRVAQKLVVIKGLAGRAAAALSQAYEVSGTPQEIARFLGIELESTRGPRRAALLGRLGSLKAERMGDDKGAFEAFEQALAVDGNDDDLRARYVAIAGKMGRWTDAAKALGRVVAMLKDPAAKARASTQLGQVLLRSGEAKRAKALLAGVLSSPDTPPDATLPAARALREILEGEKDPKALCDVLEKLAVLEPEVEARREADEKLAALATAGNDTPRAIAAYERLLSTSARPRALSALAPLYEASGDPLKHARLLEEQARDTADGPIARELMMRAAGVRSKDTKDAAAAIASCLAIVERFGPARDVNALLVPMLEAQHKWPELCAALETEARFVTGAEHAAVMSRLGNVRLSRLREPARAIEAYAAALASDGADKTARLALEKLASAGDHRLAAARVLEPVYRKEGATAQLVKMLDLRGSLAESTDERLAALREAADLAEGAGGSEAARAVDLAGKGLADAVANGRPLGEWLERLDRVAKPGADPKRRAAILVQAMGDLAVTSDELGDLARRAADALAASGDVPGAIAMYRRVLVREPQSTELLSRIDDLLRDQGSPAERIALYRAALEGAGPARRRALLHRIGGIERSDLSDPAAAIQTYGQALQDDPDDADAHAALAELYAQTGRWAELTARLEARLERVDGDAARGVRASLAELAATHGDEARARAQCARLLEDPQLGIEHLGAVERAADRLGDADLARAVLLRRAEMTQDPREQVGWLDRLGELDEQRRGDLESAATAWKRAGVIAQDAGDDEVARRMFARARRVAPDDRELTVRLVSLCERAELWRDLPPLYGALVEQSSDDAERVDLLLRAAGVQSTQLGDAQAAARNAELAFGLAPTRADVLTTFEALSVAAGAVEAFERAVDEAVARLEENRTLSGDQRAQLLLARARTLASEPQHADDAARVYRAVLSDARAVAALHAQALAAFDTLVERDPDSPRRRADRRWLLEWRAEHAPEEERVRRLLDWARAEEEVFADPVHALALHRRVLALDADSDAALTSVARLALATGDTDEALEALRGRRDRAEGPSRVAIELEIAQVLLSRTTRWQDALDALKPVLHESPGDPAARALASHLLAHRATRAGAIAMLEEAEGASDDPAVKEQILTRLLDAPADADESGARRGWFERLCDQLRGRQDDEAALSVALRATRELPEVPALWDRAEELARALKRADEVAALYGEVLGRSLSRDQALSIGERAVQFYEEWFEDPARVVRILERVIELDPAADWAFDRLKLLLDSAERWDDLFALYDRALDHAAAGKRITLLEEAAQTAKDFADRPDRAIHYLEQLHGLRPGDPKLVSSLERLYERQGRHRELVALLAARLPAFKHEEARRARTRIAVLWLEELGDPGQALESIEPLLQHPEPGGGGAEMDVWALLEAILAASPPLPDPRRSTMPPGSGSPSRPRRSRKSEAPPSSKASVRQRAAAWLRDHYTQIGRDADLARMLLVELETVRSTKERVKRHVQIGALFEKLGDAASALEQIGAAMVLEPGSESSREKLVELAERMGRFERLADLLAAAADACDDAERRVGLMMQAAEVRADRIGDAAGAIGLFTSVLESRGASDADVLAAAGRLSPLLEAAGRNEERLSVLERIASIERSPEGQRQALSRAAHLSLQLGQPGRAIELWERVLAGSAGGEGDLEALDSLVDLLDREGKHARLVEVLTIRARAAATDERRRADRVRVAKLLGETLAQLPEAIEAWLAIERDFGEADDAALALATLLRATRGWQDLAELLARRARHTDDEVTRGELLRQLGDVQREELDAGGDAVTTYEQALAADPASAGARAGLLALAGQEAHRAAALSVLLKTLRMRDDWRAVLKLTPQRLLAARSDAERVEILHDAAEISEKRAGDASLSFEAMRRAFALVPSDEKTWNETARLAAAASAWGGLVATYRKAVEGAARSDAALVARLRTAMGQVLETRTDDAEGALDEYLHVVRDARDLSTGCSAVRVAGRLGRWHLAAQVVADLAMADGASVPQLLQAYELAAGSAGAWGAAAKELSEACARVGLTGDAARDIESGVARWYRDSLGDTASAETAYIRALSHDATNVELLRALSELQRSRRDRVFVETLLRLSRATGAAAGTGGSPALLREAAEVARDSVGDRPLAISILVDLLSLARSVWTEGARADAEVVAEAPTYARWAVESLAELHAQQGDPASQVDVLVAGDALPFPAEVRQVMRRQAARVAHDGLRDHDRAIRLYLALLDERPGDAEAVDALASMYRAHGRTADLLILRERQIASGAPKELRLELRLEAAALLVSLGEAVRAVASLRESLSEEPWHEATVEALAGVLESEGKLSELRELLGEQAGRAEERGETARAAELWARAAAVALDRQRDTLGAETYHARVVALEPRVASLTALAKLTSARGDPAAAATWLERLVEVVPAESRVESTLRLAEALVRSGQVERAAERLEATLATLPEAEALRQRLHTLYREQQDWERLGRLIASSAAHAPDKAGRLSRLLEAATLFGDRCSRPDLAIPLLEQASDLAQQDPSVRLQLAGALASASRFDEARAILQAMIDAFGGRRPKERAPVHYQIARLELAMGNRARALVELDTATRVDPQNPEILRTLAELARDDGQLERAEKSYRALLVVLRRREEAGDNGGIARSEVLLELSVIANRQGEGDRASEILESALEAATKNEFEQERLESSLRARGDDETLVRVLEAKLARLGDSAAAARALTELANVLSERLGRPEQALPARLRAVTLDPGSPAAHEAALALSRTVGRVDAYLACARTLVDHAVAAGDVALAASLLVRLGTIAEDDVGDKAQSAKLYERALELGVRTPQVLRALDRVYEQLGDADNQARILSMRAEVDAQVDGAPAAADSTYRLAALRLSARGTFDVGVELLRKALEIDPQLDRAEAVLRKALEIDGSDAGLLDLYEHVGRQPGHERTLIDALRLRAKLPGTDVATVREAVDLAVSIGDPSLAESLLERFVEGETSATQNVESLAWALATLASLKETAGEVRQAVDLKKAAARVAEPETARRLEFEVAKLAAEKLDDLTLAAETYESLRTRDPADREAWEPLAEVYRRKGDARKLADLLASVVDYVDDVGERSRIRLERVRALTQDLALGDAEAAPLLREIVDEDPSQVEAALLLAGILERSGAKDDLAELLARQLDAAKDRSDAASIASLALRLGGLLEETDRMQARNVYYAGLDWEPRSRGLLDALARMLGAEDDPGERADLLERRLTIEEGATAEPLALQLAALRRELGDPAAAERALELGYRANPASTQLRDHLESTFRERGLWRKLAELWMLDASCRTDPAERVGRLREAASLFKGPLQDPKGASEALRLALEACPEDVAILDELVETSLAAGAAESAVRELSAFIERSGLPPATRAALLARRSDVRGATGDPAGALEDMESAFAIDRAKYAGALGARLARSREGAQRAGDAATERLMRLRAAQVLPYAGEVDEARTILAELVRQDPRDKAALKTLASLETALERWDGASAALRRLVALEEDGAAAVETALRLADVCERGGRPGDARGVLERARLVAPQDRSISDRLQRVYEQTGAWHELANLALEDARGSGDVAERFAALVRAGVLLLEQAGDAAGAMVPLEEARALRPIDPACVGPLADAYTLSGRAPEAAALIEQVLAPHKGKRSRELAPLYIRLARAARYVGDEAGELRSMSLALDCDAQNGEVCADVALRAVELEQFELANRALRSVTLLKTAGPMSKALAYQYMGEIARKQGDPKRALMLLKRALTEDPTLEGARALIDAIERGS
jgi:tetratricopeptide (TPR) repeat protein